MLVQNSAKILVNNFAFLLHVHLASIFVLKNLKNKMKNYPSETPSKQKYTRQTCGEPSGNLLGGLYEILNGHCGTGTAAQELYYLFWFCI